MLFILLILALLGLILALFLPTFFEIRKPKDSGPREILESTRRNLDEHHIQYAMPPENSFSRQSLPKNLQHIQARLKKEGESQR